MECKSDCANEVERRSVERTSPKTHWNCTHENDCEKLCMVVKYRFRNRKNCVPCQETKSAPAVAPLHPWIWPVHPWQRVHIDFARQIAVQNYLVDFHSK